MNVEVFDRLTVVAGEASSRRRVLGGMAAVVGALVLGDAALAEKGGNGKGTGKDKGKGKGDEKPKERGFAAHAAGSVTQPAAEECQFPNSATQGVCTTGFGGKGNAGHLGKATFDSSLVADWNLATPNGVGGFCAPVTGAATLTSKAREKNQKGSLSLTVAGTVCEVGPSAADATLELKDATFAITGGTARYEGATGAGDISGSVAADGTADFDLKGKITY